MTKDGPPLPYLFFIFFIMREDDSVASCSTCLCWAGLVIPYWSTVEYGMVLVVSDVSFVSGVVVGSVDHIFRFFGVV